MAKRAVALRSHDNKPDCVVRAPVLRRAVWQKTLDDAEMAYSVKLNIVPMGNQWGGTLMLLPPLNSGDQEAE